MVIKVRDYIENAFSLEDADRLSSVIKRYLSEEKPINKKIELDFDEIKFFTTLFFNNAIVKFVGDIGIKEFSSRISLINLSPVGKETYKHSLENGKEYYSLSEEEKEIYDRILEDNQESLN